MAQTSPAAIKIPSLNQIGIVVKDVEKTAQNYWNILGIGPWTIYTMEPPNIYDLTYRGKPAHFRFKAGFCQMGEIEFELMETLEGTTTYTDFMAEHGEGAHHLNYLVDSLDVMDRHVEIMAKKGFPSLMGGRVGSNGGFVYIDTRSALGTIWEIVKMPDEFSGPSVKYPPDEAEKSPAKVKFKEIFQVNIAVNNLEEIMTNYWNILGVGPWDIAEAAPPALHDLTYHGKPSYYTMRLALAMAGAIQLELAQPTSGDTPAGDFLHEHGEGIHHLGFVVDDRNETTKIMEKEGFATLTSGGFFEGGSTYYDTVESLKTVWEAFQPSKAAIPVTRFIPK